MEYRMNRGVGVIQYCNAEGGSGFITNPALPWLSKFDITQLSPVYDQNVGWLRNDPKPGAFTYYPQFDEPGGLPTPTDTSCGIGDLVLLRSDVVAPMPSITSTARQGCETVSTCPSGIAGWIENNPWLAVGIAVLGGMLLFGGKR
jgi:hypothetical protein